MYIIRTVRVLDYGHPVAPQPEEIPQLIGRELDSLPIDSLLPVQELIGDKVILDWVMQALSDVTLEAKELEFQIRQPTAAYYRAPVNLDREQLCTALTLVLEAWNSRLETHFALLDRLHDIDNHIGRKRPWTVNGYYSIQKRPEIKQIVTTMKEGLDRVRVAHKETEEVLRTGGYTA